MPDNPVFGIRSDMAGYDILVFPHSMRVYILYRWLVTPINKFYEATSLILHKKEKIHRK